jgi:hypothetical protein
MVFGMWWRHKPEPKLTELVDELSSLKRQFQALKDDWEIAHDKLTIRLRSLARVRQSVEESQEQSEVQAAPVFSANEQLMLGRLPPTQRRIQEQILMRRKQNGGV